MQTAGGGLLHAEQRGQMCVAALCSGSAATHTIKKLKLKMKEVQKSTKF